PRVSRKGRKTVFHVLRIGARGEKRIFTRSSNVREVKNGFSPVPQNARGVNRHSSPPSHFIRQAKNAVPARSYVHMVRIATIRGQRARDDRERASRRDEGAVRGRDHTRWCEAN